MSTAKSLLAVTVVLSIPAYAAEPTAPVSSDALPATTSNPTDSSKQVVGGLLGGAIGLGVGVVSGAIVGGSTTYILTPDCGVTGCPAQTAIFLGIPVGALIGGTVGVIAGAIVGATLATPGE